MPGPAYVGIDTPYARTDSARVRSIASELIKIGSAADQAAAGVGLTTNGAALFNAAGDISSIGGTVANRSDLADSYIILPNGKIVLPGGQVFDGGIAPVVPFDGNPDMTPALLSLMQNQVGSEFTRTEFAITFEGESGDFGAEFTGTMFIETQGFPDDLTVARVGFEIDAAGKIPPKMMGPFAGPAAAFDAIGGDINGIVRAEFFREYQLPPGADPHEYTDDAITQLTDLVQNGSYNLDDLNVGSVDELIGDIPFGNPSGQGVRFEGGIGTAIDSSDIVVNGAKWASQSGGEALGDSTAFDAWAPSASGDLSGTVAYEFREWDDGSSSQTFGVNFGAEGSYAGPDHRERQSEESSGWNPYGVDPAEPKAYEPYASPPASDAPHRRPWPLIQGSGSGDVGLAFATTTLTLPDGTTITESAASKQAGHSNGQGTQISSPFPGALGVPTLYQDAGGDDPGATFYVSTCVTSSPVTNERGVEGDPCVSRKIDVKGNGVMVGGEYSIPSSSVAFSGEFFMETTKTTADEPPREWTNWEWEPYGTGPVDPGHYDKYDLPEVEPEPQPTAPREEYKLYLPFFEANGQPETEHEPFLIKDMPPIERERLYLSEPILKQDPASGPETYIVEDGDNFWYISEEMTEMANDGEPVSDAEFKQYWQDIQEINYENLRVEGNPDLIFEGQEMTLPGEPDVPTWRVIPQ